MTSAPPASLEAPQRASLLTWRWTPLLLGVALRLVVFPWTENLWGDAPVRTEIARRWAEHPGIWWSFREVFQFGPLPIHLGGLAIRLGLGADAGPRLAALAAGILCIWLAARVARRIGGEDAALVAAYAVALNPLHIQASTTFVSEAIYAAIVLACLDLTLAGRLVFAGFATAAATVTRFDSWLWLALWGGWLLWKHRATAIPALLIAALGPASILLANHFASGHALAPLTFVENEHTALALRDQARLGAVTWRLLTLAFWPGMLVAAMTPGFASRLREGIASRKHDGRGLLIAIPALVPPLIYMGKTFVLGAFWPMPRLIVPTSTFFSALLAPASVRGMKAAIGIALALNVGLAVATVTSSRAGEVASRVSPIVRLASDLRAGVDAWKQKPSATLLDEVSTWEDIAIAYHAGQDRDASRHEALQRGVRRVIAIRGGRYDQMLRSSAEVNGQRFQMTGELGRVSWWDVTPARHVDRPMDE